MTNREWINKMDNETLAKVIIGVNRNAKLYDEPLEYIKKWLEDDKGDWWKHEPRDLGSEKE